MGIVKKYLEEKLNQAERHENKIRVIVVIFLLGVLVSLFFAISGAWYVNITLLLSIACLISSVLLVAIKFNGKKQISREIKVEIMVCFLLIFCICLIVVSKKFS